MLEISEVCDYLRNYNKKDITIMEVCGSHTAAIAKNGIRDIISPKIHLVSGPGCPVCVTPSAYVDRLIELAKEPNTWVVTFGDLLRVPGSSQTLSQARSQGAKSVMVYSPMDTLKLAKEHPDRDYIFAAIGFETTTPVYALLMEQIATQGINNVKLLTALKTMPEAISWLCENGAKIDGFLAPGHVAVITGSDTFKPLSDKYQIPFGVAGFGAEELIIAIYGIVKMIEDGLHEVRNYYPSVVSEEGNLLAQEKIDTYFEKDDAVWRGMGSILKSGRILRKEFEQFDAGSRDLIQDIKINKGCCCDKILMGKMKPVECPLFRKVCNPQNPQGACMVSSEGSCYQSFLTN